MLNLKNIDTVVNDRLDWMRLDTIFNPESKRMTPLVEKYGNCGVYQVCTTSEKMNEIIYPNLGYIGKSKSIFGRTYCLKINKHNACNYIKHNKLEHSDVWVRYFFTENERQASDLERLMHEEMEKAHGYRFKWREASAGTDGSILRLYEMIDKLSDREEAENVYAYVRQRCVDLYLESLVNTESGE